MTNWSWFRRGLCCRLPLSPFSDGHAQSGLIVARVTHVRACVLHDNDIAANPTDLVLVYRDYPGYDGCTVMPNHKVVIPIDILEKKLFTISENDMKQVFLHMLADHTFSPLQISIRKIIRERLMESFYNTKGVAA